MEDAPIIFISDRHAVLRAEFEGCKHEAAELIQDVIDTLDLDDVGQRANAIALSQAQRLLYRYGDKPRKRLTGAH